MSRFPAEEPARSNATVLRYRGRKEKPPRASLDLVEETEGGAMPEDDSRGPLGEQEKKVSHWARETWP